MLYSFTWAGADDPRQHVVEHGGEVVMAARRGRPFRKWLIKTMGDEDRDAVVAALDASGSVAGAVVVDPAGEIPNQ